MRAGTKRKCTAGHVYYKSSDCPVCPVCEKERNAGAGFLSRLGAPARRALEGKGIRSVEQLARFTEKEILQLHGMGPASLPVLKKALIDAGLSFNKQKPLK